MASPSCYEAIERYKEDDENYLVPFCNELTTSLEQRNDQNHAGSGESQKASATKPTIEYIVEHGDWDARLSWM